MKLILMCMRLVLSFKRENREIEKLPEAVLPQLPFSWSKPPSFYIKEMTHLVECILEESRKMPTPAYEWSDSISFYMYRAATSSEVVSLVDFVRQVWFNELLLFRIVIVRTIRLSGSV